jgi:tRNA (guanosine-2'-O-)-methyltransferase
MKALDTKLSFPLDRDLPVGPPLYLERAGRATELLTPFVLPERLERLRAVLARRTRRLTLLLEAVHDAHNIAACVRTCDAFGLQDLHIIPPGDKPLRLSKMVSTGAHRWLTVHIHACLDDALGALSASGYRLAITDVVADTARDTPATVDLDEPLCLAFGNERDGITDALSAAAERRLHIPMAGFVESFNVSVAVAISVSRIRERIDALDAGTWRLAEAERRAILDTWIVEDVPRSRAVLLEISRRHASGLSPDGGSA